VLLPHAFTCGLKLTCFTNPFIFFQLFFGYFYFFGYFIFYILYAFGTDSVGEDTTSCMLSVRAFIRSSVVRTDLVISKDLV